MSPNIHSTSNLAFNNFADWKKLELFNNVFPVETVLYVSLEKGFYASQNDNLIKFAEKEDEMENLIMPLLRKDFHARAD